MTSVSLKAGTLDDVFLKYAGQHIGEGDLTWQNNPGSTQNSQETQLNERSKSF